MAKPAVEQIVGQYDTAAGLSFGLPSEPFYRVRITPQGEVQVGNGQVPPSPIGGGAAAHPDLGAHDTLGLATQAELDAAVPAFPVARQASYDPTAGANNAKAINDALLAASAAGGGYALLPAGTTSWDGLVDVPSKTAIAGRGSGKGASASLLKALGATAKVQIGTRGGANNRGPAMRDFDIDGANLATNPLFIGFGGNRSFERMHVYSAAGDGIIVEEAQNHRFIEVFSTHNSGSGWVFDFGTGGHTFLGCNTRDNVGYDITYRQTGVATVGLYPDPRNNLWLGSIHEAGIDVAGFIDHQAGVSNTHAYCQFALVAAKVLRHIVRMTQSGTIGSGELEFAGCKFIGEDTRAFVRAFSLAAGTSVHLTGTTKFQNLHAVWDLAGGQASIEETTGEGSVANWAVGTGNEGAIIRKRYRCALEITRRLSTDVFNQGFVAGEAGLRWRQLADRLQIGSGADFAPDTEIRRIAADVIGTGSNDLWRTGSFTTAGRPTPAAAGEGSEAWDSSLKRPVWSDASNWHVMATKAELDAKVPEGVRRKAGWWTAAGVLPSNVANPVGDLILQPFILAEPIPVDQLGLWVATAAAGASMEGAVYGDDGTVYPGSLLVSGTFDTSVANGRTALASVTLPRGLVWIGGLALGAAATIVNGFGSIHQPFFVSQPSTHYSGGIRVTGQTALPATFPAGGIMNNGAPRLQLRMA